MTTEPLACRDCHAVFEAAIQQCRVCGSSRLTEDWAGYVTIVHPEQSELAHSSNITDSGRYALKVR